jgi:CRP-like cAMP-binding protein
MANEFATILKGFSIFEGFTEHGAQTVLESGEVVTLDSGTVLFEEGGAPDSVLLILEGDLEVYVTRDGRELQLSRAGPGAMIGELAVLCEVPRAASIRVGGGATVLRWDARQFRRLLLRDPRLSKAVFGAALKVVMEHQQALIDELAGARR